MSLAIDFAFAYLVIWAFHGFGIELCLTPPPRLSLDRLLLPGLGSLAVIFDLGVSLPAVKLFGATRTTVCIRLAFLALALNATLVLFLACGAQQGVTWTNTALRVTVLPVLFSLLGGSLTLWWGLSPTRILLAWPHRWEPRTDGS